MHYIGLMDCNNFFVSCERLFRPDLARKPVAVLSSNDGCIVSRSQEVKDLGIPMGAPYFEVRDICKKEGVTLFSSNFPLYRDLSERVMHALQEEFPQCEVYSIDEAFFRVDGAITEAEFCAIRAKIIQKTGIPVSFGIACTKTIAKAAGDYAKKGNGICILDNPAWVARIREVSCGSIWGIGRQTSRKLSESGIHTVGDFLSRGISYYRAHFGVMGERMYHELSGIPVYGFGEQEDDISKSFMSTRSFHEAVHEKSVLESALGYHAAHLGEKLRARRLAASYIRIIASSGRYSDYALRKGSASTELAIPTSDTQVLVKESLRLLQTLFDPEIPYKKAGVVLGGLFPQYAVAKTLFGSAAVCASEELYVIADTLNEKYGQGTVRPGVVLQTERWKASARLRSNEYTTNWHEIATVKAI